MMPHQDMTVRLLEDSADIPEMLYEIECWLESALTVSIDTETGSVHDLWSELPGTGQGFCRLFQIGTRYESYVIDAQKWHGVVGEVMDMVVEADRRIVFANWQYDCHVMEKEGWRIPKTYNIDDVIILHRIARPHQQRHGLKPAAVAELGDWADFGQGHLKGVMKEGGWDWSTIPTDNEAYVTYAGMDTSLTCRLWDALDGSSSPAYFLELGYSFLAYRMESRGMRVDPLQLTELDVEWSTRLAVLSAELRGYGITKPLSSKAVGVAMAELGFHAEEFTDQGAAKMDKAVLKRITTELGGAGAAAAEALIEYRRLHKWRSVYVRKLAAMHTSDNRVHASIRTMEARTGRSSVTDPPIQTIPKNELTRSVFIADPGCELWAYDYDSQEARILADVSGEAALIDLFLNGDGDIHQLFANELDIDRNTAKTVVYAKMFGAGEATLGAAMGGGADLGRMINQRMAEKFPDLQKWFDSVIRQGEKHHQLLLPDGRLLACVPGEEYKLINYGIQGRGALVLKQAALRLDKQHLSDNMVMVVHDEILFQFPEGHGHLHKQDIIEAMQTVLPSGIPLSVQGEGPFKTWGEKHK